MAPTNIDQATIIILDIGENVSTPNGKNEKSFFEHAKECTAQVLERKIMAQIKELVGIILLGSKNTKNNMAKQVKGTFRHIALVAELQSPTWQMIRDLPQCPSTSRADWVDALTVAADYLLNGISGYRVANKKVILMTNFQEPHNYSSEDIEQIVNGFKVDNIQVDIIGPDIYMESLQSDDWELARHLVDVTNGATATFDYVAQYLMFHKKRAINPSVFNVDLSIGPNIKIPVTSYIKTRDEPAVKTWRKAIKDPVTSTASSTEGILKYKQHINTEEQTVVPAEKTIKGYIYGHKIIPFPDSDDSMTYDSGDKCLSIYGFTNASNINWQSLNGDGVSYVFGRKGDKKAQNAIKCLVECLHEANLVGIARRVYRKGTLPKMYALMPVIDTDGYFCLSMISICYKEEIKYMAFPSTSLKKYENSSEQVEAFKDLIRAMDLTNAYDDSYDDKEAFPIAQTVSPTVQYVLDCIAYRAMNPGKPLPQPRDDIMMLFKVPPLIEKRSREPLDKLKKIFTLTKVEHKAKEKKKLTNLNDNAQQIDSALSNQVNDNKIDMPKVQLITTNAINDIEKIGSKNPIGDFEILIKHKPLAEVSQQMSKVIESLFYTNFDGTYGKAIDTLKYFRERSVASDPTYYNEWFLKYKTELMHLQKNNIVTLIREKNLGFIIKDENNLSSYEAPDSHEESQMYENETVPDMTEISIKSDDMFDDL